MGEAAELQTAATMKEISAERVARRSTGPSRSESRFHVDFLGLLSFLLLLGLVGVRVQYHVTQRSAARLFMVVNDLKDQLLINNHTIYNLVEQRDQLNSTVAALTEEVDKIHAKRCPEGWTMFKCSCYLLSSRSGSWSSGRQDCTNRKADLVVINTPDEQKFLFTFTEGQPDAWIGLTDREGTWKWVDKAPLSLQYWKNEDLNISHRVNNEDLNWNKYPCNKNLRWICEKCF